MAYVRLSERERISLLMMRGWNDRQRSYNEVRQLFNETFRRNGIPISKTSVSRLIRKFNDTGSVKDRPRPGRPQTATNEEMQMDIALSFVEDPHLSTRRAALHHDVSHMSVHRCLKSIRFHPYKMHLVQELNEDDPDRRIEFCDEMMTIINNDNNFLHNIVFSDEATFQLNGHVNRHNFRYYSDVNPHWMVEYHTQYPEKLNVWAGILNNTLIGPFFIDGNLNAQKYETMLRDEIVPEIRRKSGENFENIWFQQDGAPAHFGREVVRFLNENFPNQWIGRRGEIEWPPRSPDLAPLDYFFWGCLKERVYKIQPRNLEELRNKIAEEAALIDAQMIRDAVDHFYHRLAFCQEADGNVFEHLL